jgi:hypothetical protein
VVTGLVDTAAGKNRCFSKRPGLRAILAIGHIRVFELLYRGLVVATIVIRHEPFFGFHFSGGVWENNSLISKTTLFPVFYQIGVWASDAHIYELKTGIFWLLGTPKRPVFVIFNFGPFSESLRFCRGNRFIKYPNLPQNGSKKEPFFVFFKEVSFFAIFQPILSLYIGDWL